MSRHPAVAEAVRLATSTFGAHLLLAFVGGSHAAGTPSPHSDIDVFVLIDQPDPPAEMAFATKLRELHAAHGLHFDHCGEIFDAAALTTLLNTTERCLATLPALQRLACYQADCLLSVFRKGDVVFKFLADPKASIEGDRALLAMLEQRAARFFARYPMPRVQEQKDQLDVPPGDEAQLLTRFAERADGPRWFDTPVGVELGRWFLTPPSALTDARPQTARPPLDSTGGLAARRCPLHVLPPDDPAIPYLKGQCLAHIPPEGGASA